MENEIITADDVAEAFRCPTLGASYFVARRVSERAIASFEDEHMKPLVEKAAADFQDKLWDHVKESLWSDVEMNLQSEMWRAVDDIVKAILGGEQWVLQRYVLGPKYECEKVREAVAKHIPAELQSARVAELEEKVSQLEKDLEWARRDR